MLGDPQEGPLPGGPSSPECRSRVHLPTTRDAGGRVPDGRLPGGASSCPRSLSPHPGPRQRRWGGAAPNTHASEPWLPGPPPERPSTAAARGQVPVQVRGSSIRRGRSDPDGTAPSFSREGDLRTKTPPAIVSSGESSRVWALGVRSRTPRVSCSSLQRTSGKSKVTALVRRHVPPVNARTVPGAAFKIPTAPPRPPVSQARLPDASSRGSRVTRAGVHTWRCARPRGAVAAFQRGTSGDPVEQSRFCGSQPTVPDTFPPPLWTAEVR